MAQVVLWLEVTTELRLAGPEAITIIATIPLGRAIRELKVSRMAFESEKTMFEIYRESTYQGKYKVVYFTELGDVTREYEISRAIAGEHVYDGFIKNYRKEQAKQVINELLERLNNGETVDKEEIDRALKPFMPT